MKILILDSQFLTRSGLIHLLTSYSDRIAIYEADSFAVAQNYLSSGEHYDLIFTELDLPDVDHRDVVQKIYQHGADSHIVLFTWRQHSADIRHALVQGARSYLCKGAVAEQMKLAIHGLLQGREYLPEDTMYSSSSNSARNDIERHLSPRQQEIMQLLAQGLSNKEIANILGITEGTIRVHLSAIFKAIKVSNRTEATLWYLLRQNKLSA
ncbi:LuxR C-terminal-related transcriptional regulator [Aliidiomarina maris]|uniref:DNA-binding response regulator n=1 Tax=Aliidiomarina maris TaxID=531312 RepID=A0A327WQZ9_9GAMM|nr:response regulator transcription factor [Aliidiomarina maris]RAJ94624.1 LuxR family two component transcriptional regulator [Aliidiomarina maris]RUO19726.1 DNA-binding response regulator [Aliidiomarina maris]